MSMSTFEIVQMYKEAADKNAQIKILADLNLCTKQEILTLLQEEGVISGVKKKTQKSEGKTQAKPRITWDEEAKEKVRSLLREGLTVLEVAERMGLECMQVRNAVTRYKLQKDKPEEGAEKAMPKEHQKRYALENVSLIRDYAKCIVLISSGEIQNYMEIAGAFAGSIVKAADEILCEAEKYEQ